MHVHNVYFWLKDGVSASFEKGLEALVKDQYISTGTFGKPADTDRKVVDSTYSYGLTLMFDSKTAHDRYQDGKVHLDFIKTHAHKWIKVQVYDFEAL